VQVIGWKTQRRNESNRRSKFIQHCACAPRLLSQVYSESIGDRLRAANTDVNMTLAIALVAMVMVHYWGFSILGAFGHAGKFINFREGPVGFFVGLLELISELAKVISFTFRLFGNIFAGEVLLMAMGFCCL
jgi:F0F1-type ATP synthase membrane subunit a